MRHILITFFLAFSLTAFSQEDLLAELEKGNLDSSFVIQTFKGTRIVNVHSVETKPAGALEFIISHRFGPLNSGSYNLFGLDISTIRIGLEYGITDRMGIGLGRSSLDKSFDVYARYKLLRQQKGIPVTVTTLGNAYAITSRNNTTELHGSQRLAYAGQVLVARKFNRFSLQASSILLHRNAVTVNEVDNLFAAGVGGRIRITRSLSLHAEYYGRLNEKNGNDGKDPFGIGFDIETGGHVFQLIFTNTMGMTERIMLNETTGDFFDGDIHFGFNITRTFQVANRKKGKQGW